MYRFHIYSFRHNDDDYDIFYIHCEYLKRSPRLRMLIKNIVTVHHVEVGWGEGGVLVAPRHI